MRIDYTSLLYMPVLMLLGFSLTKFRLLEKKHIDSLPAVLLNIAYPALIISSVSAINLNDFAQDSLVVVCTAFAVTLVLFFFGLALLKKYSKPERKPVILFTMAVGNITFVVLPVIQSVFGGSGVFYAVLFGAAQDILVWTLYYSCFAGFRIARGATFKKLLSPSLVAIIISILLAVFGIKLSGVISDVFKSTGDITIPLALIYIGGVLAGYKNILEYLPDKDVLIISVVKVLIVPFFVFGLLQFIPVSLDLKILLSVIFAAPASVTCTIWASQFNCDFNFSIRLLMFSTALFLIFVLISFTVFGPTIQGLGV